MIAKGIFKNGSSSMSHKKTPGLYYNKVRLKDHKIACLLMRGLSLFYVRLSY